MLHSPHYCARIGNSRPSAIETQGWSGATLLKPCAASTTTLEDSQDEVVVLCHFMRIGNAWRGSAVMTERGGACLDDAVELFDAFRLYV
jgi:hypothetical protein